MKYKSSISFTYKCVLFEFAINVLALNLSMLPTITDLASTKSYFVSGTLSMVEFFSGINVLSLGSTLANFNLKSCSRFEPG